MKVRIQWRRHVAETASIAENSDPEPGIIEKLMMESCAATDAGCVRTNNEDYYLVDPAIGLYLVADGMGGAQAGEHASRLAAETVREFVKSAPRSNGDRDPRTLIEAFEEANRRVMDKAAHDPTMEGMGTTLVAALEAKDELLVASVGDSRLYLLENGRLISITEDQTWVNEVGRRLGLDEESLRTHPMRHVLTMAIGVSDDLRVHTYVLKPASGMLLLLCSDGLHSVAREEDVERVMSSSRTLEQKCAALIEAARAQGGPDNITVIILKTQ
ncbi:MAG TPA: Stp1/IreP family PP2C-type Ser/Thr phosphatase [Bryobacteraceae bacterium]|nr:Stp1/IreP family PP2C-type Ser/Thr phosphatase [Bryobacteraceae bacterium]